MTSQPKPERMQDPADAPTIKAPGTRYHLEETLTDRAKAAYERCVKSLTTGLTDWVVTDQDTANVMAALGELDYAELVAVIHGLGETADGSSNFLAKLYQRGIESEEQLVAWRKLLYDKFLAAAKDGQLPDLDAKIVEYQLKYVPEKTLERGF